MRLGELHHVAIAVPAIEDALPFYVDVLGMRAGEPHEVPGQSVRAVFVTSGTSRLELIEPTVPGGGVARFLEDRGKAALHHVCYEVADLARALGELSASGVELIDRAPRPGLAGDIAFLHPRASGGVLVELLQRTGGPDRAHTPRE